MAFGSSYTIFTLTEFFLFFILVTNCDSLYVVSVYDIPDTQCPECPGPIKYYEEIGCTPIYENSGDCCAVAYNCTHWENLSDNKCLLNGYLYSNGEKLREVDRNPCDDCTCIGPGFYCVSGYCEPKANCYRKKNTQNCCGAEVCPKREEDRPTCVVDGKVYKDGEFFIPSNDSEKHCYCGEGYTGENIEPFCASPKHSWCNTMIYHQSEIRAGCAPVYFFGESPQKHCNTNFQCQNGRDFDLVRNYTFSIRGLNNSELMCHYGSLQLRIGEELDDHSIHQVHDLKCVCEVPPLPTCRRTNNYMHLWDFWPSGRIRYISKPDFAF